MRILVAGPESSGTRMMTALLRKTGAEVTHSSPVYKDIVDWSGRKYNPSDYDAVVLVVRNGSWNALSMVARNRWQGNLNSDPHEQIANDLWDVLDALRKHLPIHVVTYEAMVYETEPTVQFLCAGLGVAVPREYDLVKNGNEKFWAEDAWEGDDRHLHER